MVVKEVKNLCFDLLKEKLAPLEYKPNKKEQRLTKLNDLGFEEISFGTVEYAKLKTYKVYFYVSVRLNAVEDLKEHFIQFFDESAKHKNPTCNINCGSFIGNPDLKFEIKSPEDVENAVATFWNVYNEHAIEYIKKCYDIQFLNSLYTTYGKDCKDWLTISDWFIVVPTIAFLADIETFPAFRKEFTDYLINELKMPENKQQEYNAYLDKITTEN